MALRKILQRYIFSQGTDSRTDSLVTPLGKLHRLMNGRFSRVGAITKREGYDALPTTVRPAIGGISSVPSCSKMLSWNGQNFPVANTYQSDQRTLSPKIGIFPNKTGGAVTSWSVKTGLTGLSFTESKTTSVPLFGWHVQDCAVGNGFLCSVYATTNARTENLSYSSASALTTVNSKIQVIISNTETGNVIYTVEILNSSNPKVVFKNQLFHLFYLDSAGSAVILARSLDTTSSSFLLSSASSIISDLSITANKNVYDVTADSSNIYIAYINTAGKIKISTFTNPPTLLSPTATYTGADNAYLSVFVTVCSFGVVVAYSQIPPDAIRCRYMVLSTGLALTGGPATFFVSTDWAYAITGGNRVVTTPTYGGVIPLLTWTFSAAATGNVNKVYTCEVNATGSTPAYNSLDLFLPHVYPVSKVFSLDSGTQDCFICIHATADTTKAQYVTFRIPRGFAETYLVGVFHAVARWGYGEAPNGFTNVFGSPVTNIGVDSNFCYFPSRRVIREFSKSLVATSYTYRAFSPSTIKFPIRDLTSVEGSEIGGTCNVTSGLLEQFDGEVFTHNNFLRPPEIMSVTTTAAGNPALTASSAYTYIATYEWTDALGKVHRSGPSAGVLINTPAGNNAAVLTVRSYGWDAEKAKFSLTPTSNLVIRVYRTSANGIIFYSLLEFPDSYSSISATITDAATDTNLIANEILYVQSGELENYTPAGVRHITVWNNRAWVVAYDGVRYSKFTAVGDPLEFAEEFLLDLEEEGGDPVATAALDTKLLIFKRNRIYFITGDGPNDAGEGGTFSGLQLISSSYGAVTPQSVVALGDRVLFRASNGFMEITSDFVITDISEGAYYFQNENNIDTFPVTTGEILNGNTEVRFLDSANAYIYNYDLKQWSMYPSVAWKDSKDTIVINSAGEPLVLSPTNKKDSSTAYSMSITTGWISLAEFQGFQRIYKALFIGKAIAAPSTFSIKIEIEYDFVPQVEQTMTFSDVTAGMWTNDESKYFSTVGGAGTGLFPFQLRIDLKKQKCQSLRITVSDTSTASSGLSFDAVGITLELGVEGNAYKVVPKYTR